MKKKLIIIGAGGFAKSIIDSINYTEMELIGFVDTFKQGYHQGYPIIANDISEIEKPQEYVYFIGVGEPKTRFQFLVLIKEHKLTLVNIIDPTSLLSRNIELGEGIYIGKLCIVNSDTKILDGVVINTRSLIEHGNQIGVCSNISTNVVLNGDVKVGNQTFIGSCTVVNGQIEIGNHSIIGSGSVVIRNITNKVVVAGSPTRLIREIK
ncbi:shikimate dehydrogenase [Photobacterium phosphoreum]|uniref:Shikimate dehydrogenase n=1 Tax=Photobacterium phosphoreum TaxID=659 RepID=A0A2T3JFU6_PHOPO|nr:acetyltransferase [Photobacterium phosphoreum]PSU20058.1 shikimate dehydrogenase [Photobacterium phosphoreum]PSU37733.1 shikimate dehydrogenase [Photobacterium phosphoreum]PSU47791.1 shikimate dehydrogenase [Photobacterium phosphoreum]